MYSSFLEMTLNMGVDDIPQSYDNYCEDDQYVPSNLNNQH